MFLPSSIPHSIRCHYCLPFNQESKLKWNEHPHPFLNFYGGKKSKYLSYYCDKCKNGFTTTESDTISLNRYKLNKIRIQKIKKIYENMDNHI